MLLNLPLNWQNGIIVSQPLSLALERAKPRLINDPTMGPIFYPKGNQLSPGDRLIQRI